MTSTPCAACKFLRRKCTQECVFAPYFPPTDPHKFAFVHRVFGASNVAKILNELPTHQREEAVNSLFYEAEARLRDPVYGCVGLISLLQQRLKKVQQDLVSAKNELAAYMGPEALAPFLPSPGIPSPHLMNMANNTMPMLGTPHGQPLVIHELSQQLQPQPQLTVSDTQRIATMFLDQDQEMFRGYGVNNTRSVTATGLNQMDINGGAGGSATPPLALGSFGDSYQNHHHGQAQQLIQTQLVLQPPVLQEQPEAQFLMQSMIQEQPEPEQELHHVMEEQTQLEQGRPGSEEASN